MALGLVPLHTQFLFLLPPGRCQGPGEVPSAPLLPQEKSGSRQSMASEGCWPNVRTQLPLACSRACIEKRACPLSIVWATEGCWA